MTSKLYWLIMLFSIIVLAVGCKKVERNNETYNDPFDKPVSAIATHDNWVWIGTSGNGIFKFDGKEWIAYTQADGLLNDTITSLAVNNNGILWVGTNKGISIYENAKWTTMTTKDGLYSNDIRSLACDKENNFWIGTRNNRLVKYDGNEFTTYHVNPVASGPEEMGHIHTITCDLDGNVWVGSCISGLSKFDGQTWTDSINNLTTFVESSFCTSDNEIWIGHYFGAYRFLNNEWTHFSKEDGLTDDIVNCFAADQQNNIWIGTNSGLSKYDGDTFKNFTVSDGLPDNEIKALGYDYNIWVGTSNGLLKMGVN